MLTIHVWPKWLKRFLLTHPLYKSPASTAREMVISNCRLQSLMQERVAFTLFRQEEVIIPLFLPREEDLRLPPQSTISPR